MLLKVQTEHNANLHVIDDEFMEILILNHLFNQSVLKRTLPVLGKNPRRKGTAKASSHSDPVRVSFPGITLFESFTVNL